MTQFGPGFEPITFPTPSRYATIYATDACWRRVIKEGQMNNNTRGQLAETAITQNTHLHNN